VRCIGACDQCLGRSASGIDTSAAEQLALDDGDLPARRHQAPRQCRAGLSRADDDPIIVRPDWPPISNDHTAWIIVKGGGGLPLAAIFASRRLKESGDAALSIDR